VFRPLRCDSCHGQPSAGEPRSVDPPPIGQYPAGRSQNGGHHTEHHQLERVGAARGQQRDDTDEEKDQQSGEPAVERCGPLAGEPSGDISGGDRCGEVDEDGEGRRGRNQQSDADVDRE
jgi:hypothetical protein